ncbi:formimidoylglutamase [Psychroserpens sp.]|uniref:formimidoylglutamase n=1 Tax=Psychroserpens sp. TaxID=2020870 RepID=UPI001B145B13|nr:formimidoylglutamase [Psychroserpens sp.]MBO6606592.1 formimidoylglutamase [Psychroserpens sp.]MBO6653296.1 formimidoylglutamase [Psychroserpens sp.]MBO6680677.1 formimidoylglutamase [Psychroserpens sp.]MBO6750365.1 formimidoylglutamase [Psychroserpens sp.]MBO6914847.1 formimidoylglutamase [Psychroserpens sp.]
MEHFQPFTSSDLKSLLNKRSKESKFGEHVSLLSDFSNIYEQLSNIDVRYVIFGIKDDVGVFANYGHTGTSEAWNAVIKSLINIQSNAYTKAKKVLILGHLSFDSYHKKLDKLEQGSKKDITKARKIVTKIDEEVSFLVSQIVSAGKIPIIIGGGHNNAYGNIKGTALALKRPINAINFDAHHDFRAEEGRHSGNGFSYSYAEGFLKRYFIFGLHENYTSDRIFKTLKKIKSIQYNTFESIAIRKHLKFKSELNRALDHLGEGPFGLEIDCDAIQGISSSAMTPSGFSPNSARRFIDYFGRQKDVTYLHICEAAPNADNASQIGKLISYLITDFIRANSDV